MVVHNNIEVKLVADKEYWEAAAQDEVDQLVFLLEYLVHLKIDENFFVPYFSFFRSRI
jgi:hypothetical protein